MKNINNIKNWYKKEFPTDEAYKDINSQANFQELIKNIPNVYEYLYIHDSLIRERVFTQLAKINDLEYNDIYNIWLNSDNRAFNQ